MDFRSSSLDFLASVKEYLQDNFTVKIHLAGEYVHEDIAQFQSMSAQTETIDLCITEYFSLSQAALIQPQQLVTLVVTSTLKSATFANSDYPFPEEAWNQVMQSRIASTVGSI